MGEVDPNFLKAKLAEATKRVEQLESGGGGGHHGGMEARIAKLEALTETAGKRLDRIEQDLRMVLAALALGFLTLAGMTITSYLKVSDRLEGLSANIESVKFMAAQSDAKLSAILDRLPSGTKP
ncbi:MAG: hypothetical protein HYU60_03835 [Magnetospirillum sp.]|nr:hypothetical protein [Magnetospirillum sp.]